MERILLIMQLFNPFHKDVDLNLLGYKYLIKLFLLVLGIVMLQLKLSNLVHCWSITMEVDSIHGQMLGVFFTWFVFKFEIDVLLMLKKFWIATSCSIIPVKVHKMSFLNDVWLFKNLLLFHCAEHFIMYFLLWIKLNRMFSISSLSWWFLSLCSLFIVISC